MLSFASIQSAKLHLVCGVWVCAISIYGGYIKAYIQKDNCHTKKKQIFFLPIQKGRSICVVDIHAGLWTLHEEIVSFYDMPYFNCVLKRLPF